MENTADIFEIFESLIEEPDTFQENMESLFTSFENNPGSLKVNRHMCVHGIRKYYCRECGGSQLCMHNEIKYTCKKCKGSQICDHGRKKAVCKLCGGSQICVHGGRRDYCKKCGGT